jgi:plastocyanin
MTRPLVVVPLALMCLGASASLAAASESGDPAPAPAMIVAGPGGYFSVGNYYTPAVVALRGQAVTFGSFDIEPHNVVSVRTLGHGKRARPLFESMLLDFGETGPVRGAAKLAPGIYEFFCTLHPWMRGRLVVTSAPVTPRGAAGR